MVKKRVTSGVRERITDSGLARRLGQEIYVTSRGQDINSRVRGRLVFFPDKYVLLTDYEWSKIEEGSGLYPIKKGDVITLVTGNPPEEHVVRSYRYAGKSKRK